LITFFSYYFLFYKRLLLSVIIGLLSCELSLVCPEFVLKRWELQLHMILETVKNAVWLSFGILRDSLIFLLCCDWCVLCVVVVLH